jgi:hypothetical protein
MHDGFMSLSEIFDHEPALSGLRKIIKESDVVAKFPEIFPDLKKVAEAVKVEKRTIFLKVENSTWRSELKFREKIIVDKINGFFKEDRIKYVRFLQ